MSLLGNLVREITKTAASVGEVMVNGVADITEVVTGPNQVTGAVRETGVKVIHGAKSITDAVVDMGEEMLGVDNRQAYEPNPRDSQGDNPANA